jgi:hypothetical protein
MSCFILMNYIQNIKKKYNIHSLKYLKIKKKNQSLLFLIAKNIMEMIEALF